MRISVVTILLAAFLPAAALAQDAKVEPPSGSEQEGAGMPPRGPGWTATVEPAAWFVAAGGSVKLPRSAAGASEVKTQLSNLNMDSPVASPAGEINLRRGEWRIAVRGFSYSSTNQATLGYTGQIGDIDFSPGTRVESTLDFAAFELEGAYNLTHADLGEMPGGRRRMYVDVDAVAGIRLYDVSWQVDRVSPGIGVSSDSADQFFWEPQVGAKFSMRLYEQFDIDVQLTGGALPLGDTSTFSVDVMAGFMWRPMENVGVQVGYRQLAFELSDGDGAEEFRYRGALAGLSIGVVFKF